MVQRLIGDVASAFGMNPRTLRYYEALGLLPVPFRSGGGYRLYDEEAVTRLAFIAEAKSLGLTLKEIGRILTLRDRGQPPCSSLRQILLEHVNRIDHQVAHLRALKSDLRALLAGCQRNLERNGGVPGQRTVCPVMETNGGRKHHAVTTGGGSR